jgi:hypothetical protein
VSTRKLIIAALVTGLVILVAFTVQVYTAANNRDARQPVPAPTSVTSTTR